jgi:hypothetical protein
MKMLKALDPMWEYGEPIEHNNQQKLNCKLCGKELTSGISWLKCHIAQISRHEVGICPKSTTEIIHIANQSLLEIGKKKEARQALRLELATRGVARTTTRSESLSLASPPTMPHSNLTFLCSKNHNWHTILY